MKVQTFKSSALGNILISGLGILTVSICFCLPQVTVAPSGENSSSASTEKKSEKTSEKIDFADAPQEKLIIWDGDAIGSSAKAWNNCNLKGNCNADLETKSGAGKDGSVGLVFYARGKDWKGFGWNWFGWYPEGAGTDVTEYKNLSLWIKIVFDSTKEALPDAGSINVGMHSAGSGDHNSNSISISEYIENAFDGQWHELTVPIREFSKNKPNFDITKISEIRLGQWDMKEVAFTAYIDEIGFDNKEILAMISMPETRKPHPLDSKVNSITAEIDNSSDGKPVSPYIYGANFGDPEVYKEMGVTMRRIGGNEHSPYDWRTGYTNKGADWYFQNHAESFKHPEENRWIRYHKEDMKFGFETYMTLGCMGVVAKDGKSVGFPKHLYPDQTGWAPDREATGNGKIFLKDASGNIVLENGKPKETSIMCGGKHPSQTGKAVTPDDQTEVLSYCLNKAGIPPAKKGGIKVICLSNEPMLWIDTHRDMVCQPTTGDDFWKMTVDYATRLKKIDPDVKIAGPGVWGWTAYWYTTADQEWRRENNASWDNTKFPEYSKNGPWIKDWIKRLKKYKDSTGIQLVDIVDIHGYPMTSMLDGKAKGKDNPEVMEFRLRDVRKFWDPDYRDPVTWMGGETGGKLAYINMMKAWIDSCYPGLEMAIGEYDHSGGNGGFDVSCGLAQAEVFAAFAQADLAYGLYWANVAKHSPGYFAWKMFLNPDGKQTAVGDNLLTSKVSDFDKVSVHTFKDKKKNVISFIVINKKAAEGANVNINLAQAIPEQSVSVYEYSRANIRCIGKLPDKKVGGQSIVVDVPSMSMLRFDVKM